MSLEFKINDKFFKQSLISYSKENEKVIKDAFIKVGHRIVKDCVTLPPKAPILDGFLTGGFTVAVTDREISYPRIGGNEYPTGGETGERTKRPLDPDLVSEPDTDGMKKFELRVGNSMKYARRLHENPFTPGPWSERRGNVGYKFISIKLYAYGEKYLNLLSEFIKDGMTGRLFK